MIMKTIEEKLFVNLLFADENFAEIVTQNKLTGNVFRMSRDEFRSFLLIPAKRCVEHWSSGDEEFKETFGSSNFEELNIEDFCYLLNKLMKKYCENFFKKGKLEISEKKDRIEKLRKLKKIRELEYYDLGYTYAETVTVFKNIQVNDTIRIWERSKKEGLGWVVCIDSIFKKIDIKNSKIRGQTSAFKFSRCKTDGIKIFKSKIGDFEFVSCEIAKGKEEKIEILESKTGYFQFRRCEVGKIRIHRDSETGYFRLEDRSKIEGIELANSAAEYFRIKEYCKIGNFTIKNGSTADSFSIEKSEMLDFVFESGTFRILTFDSSQLNKFALSGNNKFDIFISGSKINRFALKECILGLETSISISDTRIFYLQMVKFAVIGNLYLREVRPMEKILKFTAWAKEVAGIYKKVNRDNENNLPKKPTFLLFHSSLGKTEFTNCELKWFTFNYSNSNLIDSFIVGGDLPIYDIQIVTKIEVDKNGKEILTFADESNSESPYQKASLFNQLKKVLERAGDTYGSSLLQSEWADNQLKYLSLVRIKKLGKVKSTNKTVSQKGFIKKIKDKIIVICSRGKRSFKRVFANIQINQDILSFKINKYSNNHDENWVKALVWILGFSVLFYLLSLLAQGEFCKGLEGGWELVGNYFGFLNPLNDTNFVDDKSKSSACAVVVDFFAKLFLGFLIYKFLRAFRKYGKK